MPAFRRVYVMGTDLEGRKCRVAQVGVPEHMGTDEALKYIRNIYYKNIQGYWFRPYASASEIEE